MTYKKFRIVHFLFFFLVILSPEPDFFTQLNCPISRDSTNYLLPEVWLIHFVAKI